MICKQDYLAGIREPELNVMCKIVEGLGSCVHELCGDEKKGFTSK